MSNLKANNINEVETVSNPVQGRFYGVYLLCSQSTEKRYNGKCYIGFTVNPNRRINQHNRGIDFGGARKTNNKGPWKMIMIIHNFPNNISALQFEWAWQQPTLSTRLKLFYDLKRKKSKETDFQYNFRILSQMLLIGPWNRLPLIIRWLEPEYECDFAPTTTPPAHMKIVSGKVTLNKEKRKDKYNQLSQLQPRAIWAPECHLCMKSIENPERSRIGCLNPLCKLTCHLICLANHLLAMDNNSIGHYIPIDGACPLCDIKLIWAEILQRKHKMQNKNVIEEIEDDEDEDFNNWCAAESDNEELLTQSNDSLKDIEIYELSD